MRSEDHYFTLIKLACQINYYLQLSNIQHFIFCKMCKSSACFEKVNIFFCTMLMLNIDYFVVVRILSCFQAISPLFEKCIVGCPSILSEMQMVGCAKVFFRNIICNQTAKIHFSWSISGIDTNRMSMISMYDDISTKVLLLIFITAVFPWVVRVLRCVLELPVSIAVVFAANTHTTTYAFLIWRRRWK